MSIYVCRFLLLIYLGPGHLKVNRQKLVNKKIIFYVKNNKDNKKWPMNNLIPCLLSSSTILSTLIAHFL